MSQKITEEAIEYMEILAKLSLSPNERKELREDMDKMLEYLDTIKKVEISLEEPKIPQVLSENVFREDVVTNDDDREKILANAPQVQNYMFQVPCTIVRQEEV